VNRTARVLDHRRQMLKQIKGWVRGYLGPEPSALKSYSQPYQREFSGRWTPCDADELFTQLKEAEIVFGGDFHGFSQAQRTHLRILRSLPGPRKVLLALEIFETRHQPLLDKFLRGQVGENEFLVKINWEKNWGFPWAHYRPLLELAKKKRWPVVALNRHFSQRSAQTLKNRDRHAAQVLTSVILRNPGALIYSIFGDLHMAGPHLPKVVSKNLKRQPRAVYLYQNSERLYFTLAKKGLEASVHLMRRGSRFCVLSSPPWVKWQSYLMFLENSLDRELFDEIGEIDLTAYIKQSVLVLINDLRVKLSTAELAAYGPEDEALMYALKSRLDKPDFLVARDFVSQGRSFYIPRGGLFFVSRPTVNHTAGLAGEFIQARLSRRDRTLWNMPDDFTKLVWIEMLSFFLSKLINHRRKPDRLRDIKAHAPKLSREVLLLVLNAKIQSISFKFGPAWQPRISKPRHKASYYFAAKMAGSLFGETLHAAYRSKAVGLKDVIKWLSVDVDSKEFSVHYRDAHRKLQKSPRTRSRLENRI
jgi:hypothetical protein